MANKSLSIFRGFTLLEMVAVVTILLILVGIVTPIANGLIEDAKVARALDLYQKVAAASRRYYQDTGKLPASLGDLYAPSSAPQGWNGPYIDRPIGAADDPFGVSVSFAATSQDFNLSPGMAAPKLTNSLALEFSAVPGTAAQKIDKELDGSLHQLEGLSRFILISGTSDATVQLFVLPTSL